MHRPAAGPVRRDPACLRPPACGRFAGRAISPAENPAPPQPSPAGVNARPTSAGKRAARPKTAGRRKARATSSASGKTVPSHTPLCVGADDFHPPAAGPVRRDPACPSPPAGGRFVGRAILPAGNPAPPQPSPAGVNARPTSSGKQTARPKTAGRRKARATSSASGKNCTEPPFVGADDFHRPAAGLLRVNTAYLPPPACGRFVGRAISPAGNPAPPQPSPAGVNARPTSAGKRAARPKTAGRRKARATSSASGKTVPSHTPLCVGADDFHPPAAGPVRRDPACPSPPACGQFAGPGDLARRPPRAAASSPGGCERPPRVLPRGPLFRSA